VVTRTKSELLFEEFCSSNNLEFEPVPVTKTPTPDYKVTFNGICLHIEIKQMESLEGFNPDGVSSRTTGSHVRNMINESRKQIKSGAAGGLPSLLLIFNAVDPDQSFGTEQHDFISAMYGEMTVTITEERITDSFQGRNAKLRHDTHTYFSGVGHMLSHNDGVTVTIYENVFSKNPIPFASIPSCINVVRVILSQDA
jgi:hypothetical protein